MRKQACAGLSRREPLGSFTYPKVLKDGLKVICKVQVYVLEASDIAKNFKEKGERTIEWVSCDEAVTRVNEPELCNLLLLFKRRINERLQASLSKQVPAE